MKRKILCCMLTLMICLSVSGSALAETRQAAGSCSMSVSGKSVSFSGYSSSAQIEDTISVTVRLMEKRGSTWYQVGSTAYKSLDDADFVSAGSSKTVTGGYYYKVIATHYSLKDGVGRTVTSQTAERWIAN